MQAQIKNYALLDRLSNGLTEGPGVGSPKMHDLNTSNVAGSSRYSSISALINQ